MYLENLIWLFPLNWFRLPYHDPSPPLLSNHDPSPPPLLDHDLPSNNLPGYNSSLICTRRMGSFITTKAISRRNFFSQQLERKIFFSDLYKIAAQFFQEKINIFISQFSGNPRLHIYLFLILLNLIWFKLKRVKAHLVPIF